MLGEYVLQGNNEVERFVHLYKLVLEREKYLSNEAKIAQYNAVLRYFVRFLQDNEEYISKVSSILFWTYIKLGDIYYEDALQNQDNSKYFLAAEYYNQALVYARSQGEKSRVLLALRDIYYYLNDEDAFFKVEETWAENRNNEDKFSAYMFLAQNANSSQLKAGFLEKALDVVMKQDKSFYTKYQDTLNICSQLIAIYELQGEREKALRIKKLRDSTLKLLN